MPNFRALGPPPPDPRVSGSWGLCPQTPSLQRLGALPPTARGSAPRSPNSPPLLQISGYAPDVIAVFTENIHWGAVSSAHFHAHMWRRMI